MNAPTLLVLTVLIGAFAGPADADFCRWVDQNGTVHFAERCPEGTEGTSITVDPGPSRAERENALRRSDALQQQRHARAELTNQKNAAETAARRMRIAEHDAALAECEQAWRELEILALAVPVYREAGGRLYYRGALHDHWFQGARHYLDDNERERERQSAGHLVASRCVGLQPHRTAYVFRYRLPPPLAEVLQLLAEFDRPWTPPGEEVCSFARNMQMEIGELQSGIPSDDERALNDALSRHCR